VYADLAANRNKVQKAELDAALAPPERKDESRDRMNAEAMRQLGGMGMIAPPPKAKRG
jgi:hypothetical protein